MGLIGLMGHILHSSLFTLHYHDTCFIEQPDGERHYEKCHGIGGGGYDGCHEEYCYYGVAAVLAHGGAVYHSQYTEQPADNGQFEDGAYHQ